MKGGGGNLRRLSVEPQQVPVLLNSFNRLGCLRRLIAWLQEAGYVNLYVIDNASTYPPLLDYLTWLRNGRATVIRLPKNFGPRVLWRQRLLSRMGIETEYIYTDPDVVPARECPRDLIGKLQSVLADHPNVGKAGVGLRLDDLPSWYQHKAAAISWERQFWVRPAGPGLFHAPVDTTFALYRPGGSRGRGGIRTGWPYVAAHEGWYLNSAWPSEEDLFYNRTVTPGVSHWSMPTLPAWLSEHVARHQGKSVALS